MPSPNFILDCVACAVLLVFDGYMTRRGRANARIQPRR